jgi:hypothetical protein
MQGTSWTNHFRSTIQLFEAVGSTSMDMAPTSQLRQCVEIMGVMDIENLVLGRQIPTSSIWLQYRSGILHFDAGEDAVEPMSGLPKSLIDILATDTKDSNAAEQMLLLWPGFPGSPLQCQLWEAFRFAAMLDLRNRSCLAGEANSNTSMNARISPCGLFTFPSTDTLIARILSSLNALFGATTKGEPGPERSVMNSILYPLLHTYIQVMSLNSQERWREMVEQWFQLTISKSSSMNTRHAKEVADEVCRNRMLSMSSTPDGVARSHEWEIALF